MTSQTLTEILVCHRALLMASLLPLVAACSNAPPKEASPGTVEAPAKAAQRPAPATSTPSRVDMVTGTPNPLKDPNNILFKREVFFDYDQSLIKDTDGPLLQAHANFLRQHPSTKVIVQGNTDERGSREYNIALGQRRADAVKRYMTLLGADDRQIDTLSFGKEKPRCTVSDESCWSQNRRVDLVYAGE
jgi:peptidoglycan-associated lipoprotein